MTHRRAIALLAIALAALATVAPVAQAAVPVSTTGKIGPFVITDRADRPGVRCTYDAGGPGDLGNDLDLMEARGPRVFARNRTSGRDRQAVSVKYLFQRSVLEGGSGGWVTAKATAPQKKVAYDDKAVQFPWKAWINPIEADYQFRTLVIIRWHKPGSTLVQGKTVRRYQYYRPLWGGVQPVEMDRCLPEA